MVAASYAGSPATYSFVTAAPSLPQSWLPLLSGVHLALALGLALWTLLFLFRIVLTWYPQIDLSRGAMRLIGAPHRALACPHPSADQTNRWR